MAIADPGRQVDGFNGLPMGMDSSKEPGLIDQMSYALGVNVTARGGKIKSRPGFLQLGLKPDAEDPDALTEFQNAYFQGACLFTQPANRDEATDLSDGGKGKTYIIVAASGWLFRIDPQDKKIIRINGTPGTLLSPKAVVSINASNASVATVTTATPHYLAPGDRITVNDSPQAGFNVTNAAVTSTPSLTTFTYALGSTLTATSTGSYSINPNNQGFTVLPKFMDTTYYTLKIAGAGKATEGTSITGASKVEAHDPHPSGISLGLTGRGFAASAVASGGGLSYVIINDPGEGFSKNAAVSVKGATDAKTSLRFGRDSTDISRPWPDRNHQTNRHYFCQAEKYLVIQDGINAPFIFDGEYLRRAYTTHPAISMGTGAGSVVSIVVTHRGSGYTSAPTVALSAPPTGGTTATTTATFNNTSGQIDSLTITSAGSGYTSAPTVTFSGGGGTGAKAYAILSKPSEVPVGATMAYGQGRLFVANPNRFEIKALDLVGSHVNKTAGKNVLDETVYPLSDPRASVLFATENQYLNEGGSLLMPAFMGKIMGMQFLPTQDTATGQGQLYVFCEFGAATFAVSGLRANWGSVANFQSILYKDIGAVGPDAFIQINGDLFFRANDGLRTYRNAAASFNSYGNTAMSAEMDLFLKKEPLHLLHNVSMAYFDKGRVLMTAQPREIQPTTPNDKAKLIYKAIVSLDFNTLSGSLGKNSAAYDGVWTGVDFLQLLSGYFGRRDQTYFIGVSCGLNSVWEIDPEAYEDRPVAGAELVFRPGILSGVVEEDYIDTGEIYSTVNLSEVQAFNPTNIKVTLTATNESANTGWTSAGMGSQGLTLYYVYSPIEEANPEAAFNNPSNIHTSRSKDLFYASNAGQESQITFDLGPIKTSGFLYFAVTPFGTLPAGNIVTFSGALEGNSSGSMPIRSELETKAFSFRSLYEEKRLIRADLWLSDLKDKTDFEVYYKPDQYPSWIFWDTVSLLPQTTASILPLYGLKIEKQNVQSGVAVEEYVIDTAQFSPRITRGIGLKLDFLSGLTPAGTGTSAHAIQIDYLFNNTPTPPTPPIIPQGGNPPFLTPSNVVRSVLIPIPADRETSRYFNLYRSAGRYLHLKITYPVTLNNSSYSVTITPFGLDQYNETPDQVTGGGFLTQLPNLKPQFAPQIRLMNPQEQADPLTGRLFTHGYDFQARLVWTGNVTIQKAFLHCQTLVEHVGGNTL